MHIAKTVTSGSASECIMDYGNAKVSNFHPIQSPDYEAQEE